MPPNGKPHYGTPVTFTQNAQNRHQAQYGHRQLQAGPQGYSISDARLSGGGSARALRPTARTGRVYQQFTQFDAANRPKGAGGANEETRRFEQESRRVAGIARANQAVQAGRVARAQQIATANRVARAASGNPPISSRQMAAPARQPVQAVAAKPPAESATPIKAQVSVIFLDGDSERQDNFDRRIRVWVTHGTVRNIEIHVQSASGIARGFTSKIYELGPRNQDVNGIFNIKIRANSDVQVFCKANGTKASGTRTLRVKASLKDADYGDKIALSMHGRQVALKKGLQISRVQKLKELLEKRDKRVFQYKAFKALQVMVESTLPSQVLVQGTRIKPETLRPSPDVLIEAIAETELNREIIVHLSKIMTGLGPIISTGVGVVKLGLAVRCGIRVYRLTQTGKKMGEYPEYTYKSREGEALFGRIGTYYREEAKKNVISAATSFAEAGLRTVLPGSVFVSAGISAKNFFGNVLWRYYEKRDAELTNLMFELARSANTANAFYEIIEGGHIVVPAYVVDRYSAKDLSNARRIYLGKAEEAAKLREGAAYLKRRGAEIVESSRYIVVEPAE